MKNLIFDLGQVLYLLDEKRFARCFAQAGIPEIKNFYHSEYASILHNYEKGLIETKTFFEIFKQKTNLNITFPKFKKCWNSLLIGFIAENLNYLRILSNKYQIFIMSNINQLHYEHILQEALFLELKQYKVYYSHFEGLRKPESAFFLRILNKNHLQPGDTFFIDDNYVNVSAAKNLGIKGIVLENPFLLIKKLKSFGI